MGSHLQKTGLCADPADGLLSGSQYQGHEEPELLFYSPVAGSGNSSVYYITLPLEPTASSGVKNCRLFSAF